MRFQTPHPIPYQGSKRLLSPAILSYVPSGRFTRLIEPFAGSGAVTLAAAQKRLFRHFVIADVLKPLTEIWKAILKDPVGLIDAYSAIWHSQNGSDPVLRFNEVRAEFNRDYDPAKLLFLLARCVKNAVRFNPAGHFNQSADKRRRGTHPITMSREIKAAHDLLIGRCEVVCADFRSILNEAGPTDLVYMDPPYQGTSDGRDSRYIKGVQRASIIEVLGKLNARGVEYLLSYDGQCGSRIYGEPLPADLHATRVLLDVGRSSQATLNGRDHRTIESLYVSPGLAHSQESAAPISLAAFSAQSTLFS